MRNEADIPGRSRAGSPSWACVLSTHYWFDPLRIWLDLSRPIPFPLWSHLSLSLTRLLKIPHTATPSAHHVLTGGYECLKPPDQPSRTLPVAASTALIKFPHPVPPSASFRGADRRVGNRRDDGRDTIRHRCGEDVRHADGH